jgi:phosphoserine phosphatase
MLETVGNAVAVSPDIALMRAANRNRWSVVEWKIKPITPRWALPR